MKKFSTALVLISFLAVLVAPMMVAAQVDEPAEMQGQCSLKNDFSAWNNVDCPASGDCPFDSATYDCAMCCVLDTVYSVTNWIFVFVLALVVIFVLIGAVQILTAGGSPEKVNTGRNYIIYAVVGAVVAALARAIPEIVKSILGIS